LTFRSRFIGNPLSIRRSAIIIGHFGCKCLRIIVSSFCAVKNTSLKIRYDQTIFTTRSFSHKTPNLATVDFQRSVAVASARPLCGCVNQSIYIWPYELVLGALGGVVKQYPSTRTTRVYRVTSLIRNRSTLGPCSRPAPRALWWSRGGGRFLMSEVALYTDGCWVRPITTVVPSRIRLLKSPFPHKI